MRRPEVSEVEKLYRAVADGEPRREILQIIFDMFGEAGDLRPPLAEMRLADQCNSKRSA